MTPEQLKASILQYAIQGKLVEQPVEMHFLVDVGLVGLFLDDIQLFLFHIVLLSEFWA